MDAALLLLRLVLAATFAIAGAAKLRDRRGTRAAVLGFGAPVALAGPIGLALPLVELAVAGALLTGGAGARAGAAAAAALLVLFCAAIAAALARGEQPDCHCFGQASAGPVGPRTLVRNAALLAPAVVVLLAGDPGPSALGWLDGADPVPVAAGAVVAVVLAGAGALAFALLRQHGELLARLEAVEAQLGEPAAAGTAAPPSAAAAAPPALVAAPAFTARDLDGVETTSSALAGEDRLLVFTDPSCGPCTALLPDVAGWPEALVISRGELERNRALAREHGIARMLVQDDREVADAFGVAGTPSAVWLRADGRVDAQPAAGADAIRALRARARSSAASAATTLVLRGTRPPAVALATPDGTPAALADLEGRDTLVVFFDERCGFCAAMADDLVRVSAVRPVALVVPRPLDALDLPGATVLVDEVWALARSLGANGTPNAVRLDAEGRVASGVVAGRQAVLDLAAAAVAA